MQLVKRDFDMNRLELLIPPPVVAVVFASAIWVLSKLIPVIWLFPGQMMGVAMLAAMGLALDITALIGFLRAKTTINPIKPDQSSTLVTGGLYRITRNPMYLGLALLVAAWTLYQANPFGWLLWLGFCAYITRFQIIPEERHLAMLFGEDFEIYKSRVRRWI